MPITIRLDRFEGPLDLLLYLIQSHELDISKISIGHITDQYLAYVRLMQELNFDIASDFLVMAATLIHWKSKAILPQEETAAAGANAEDEMMTQEELLRQLMEHQRFLEAGRQLGLQPLLGDDVYTRPNQRAPREKIWKDMDATQLALTFQDLLVRERKRTQILKKETVSLNDKIMDFADRLAVGKLIGMRALLRDIKSRPETVVTFLASLELSRLRKMKVYQEGVYEEIYVELLESLKGFDTRLASGFDAIEQQVSEQIQSGTSVAADDFAKSGTLYASGDGANAGDGTAAADGNPDAGTEISTSNVPFGYGAGGDIGTDLGIDSTSSDRAQAQLDGGRAGSSAERGRNSRRRGGRDSRRTQGDDLAAVDAAGLDARAEGRSVDAGGMDHAVVATDGIHSGVARDFDLAEFGADDAGTAAGSGSSSADDRAALSGSDDRSGELTDGGLGAGAADRSRTDSADGPGERVDGDFDPRLADSGRDEDPGSISGRNDA